MPQEDKEPANPQNHSKHQVGACYKKLEGYLEDNMPEPEARPLPDYEIVHRDDADSPIIKTTPQPLVQMPDLPSDRIMAPDAINYADRTRSDTPAVPNPTSRYDQPPSQRSSLRRPK